METMDRRIRDTLHKVGASYEYIMSRMVEVSIRLPSGDERRKGQGRRGFFTAPEEYIKESFTYLRTAARYLEMEEPSLLSIQYSIGMVILHWLAHDPCASGARLPKALRSAWLRPSSRRFSALN